MNFWLLNFSWNSRLLAEQRVVLLVFYTPPAWNSTEKGVWALAGSIFIYVNSDERAMSRVNQDESAYIFFFLLLKSSFPFWNPQRIWCFFLYIYYVTFNISHIIYFHIHIRYNILLTYYMQQFASNPGRNIQRITHFI